MSLPTQEQTSSAPPSYPKPLTDPVDLLTLLGRGVICLVLAALTIALLVRQVFGFALFVGIISLIVQRMTYKLWKRLRDERMAAQAALLTEQNETAAEGSVAP